MIQGILWAIGAGVMLGLYALPEKFTKDFKYENTWGLFFLINLILIPLICSFSLVSNFGTVLSSISTKTLVIMVLASCLWGFGCQLWSKAIDYIGVSLGFCIFIGVVILIGSILPLFITGLPTDNALTFILIGLLIILLGVIANGRAGILRKELQEEAEPGEAQDLAKKTAKGILIAVIGGLLATGFSLANAVGFKEVDIAMQAQGNPAWMSALGVMIIVYISGAIYNIPYFSYQLSKNNTWSFFKTKAIGKNIWLVFIMGLLNFSASVSFAYAASILGNAGNSVGYAIYNTASVLVAVIGGLITAEWGTSSSKAKNMLYYALVAMIFGIILIAYGNSLNI